MTNRNLEKELQYFVYNDPEYGEDMENISYPALFGLLTELLDRVEQLEQRLDKNDRWKSGLAKVAKEVNTNVQESVSNVQESVSNVQESVSNVQESVSNVQESVSSILQINNNIQESVSSVKEVNSNVQEDLSNLKEIISHW